MQKCTPISLHICCIIITWSWAKIHYFGGDDAGFPIKELKLFGSERSAGTKVKTKFGEITIEDFKLEEAQKLDVVFVSVSGDFSLEFCEKMTEKGCVVIDNSSAFRMKEGFSLCVPEINADAARKSGKKVIPCGKQRTVCF